jgi:ABC-2 type transport system ATP-binding protein
MASAFPRRTLDRIMKTGGDMNIHAGTNVVETSGLSKRFGDRVAVEDVDLRVPRGSAFGYLGPNGAGKTTLIRMLLGLTRASAGTMRLLGRPVPSDRAKALARVGAIVEEPRFYGHLTGRENLTVIAAAREPEAHARIDGALARAGLSQRADERVKRYSLGMRQRLGVARSLLADPELLILDEPTNGLDPMGMQDIRNLIRRISGNGRTVIVSSHLLSELEQVCDWLIVLDHGGLVHLGPPETLGGSVESLVLRIDDGDRLDDLAAIARSAQLPVAIDTDRGELTIALDADVDPARLAGEINRRAHAAGIVLTELHHARADLEARYLNLVNFDDEGRTTESTSSLGLRGRGTQ